MRRSVYGQTPAPGAEAQPSAQPAAHGSFLSDYGLAIAAGVYAAVVIYGDLPQRIIDARYGKPFLGPRGR